MANSQLHTVLKVESEREKLASNAFQTAQQELLSQQQKLTQLQQYRIDYLQNIKRESNAGLGAKQYQQHLSFVGKLDLACEQQLKVIAKARLLVDQRRRAWLTKQKRKKAIESLIETRKKQYEYQQSRVEQQLMDEFANQRFVRNLVMK